MANEYLIQFAADEKIKLGGLIKSIETQLSKINLAGLSQKVHDAMIAGARSAQAEIAKMPFGGGGGGRPPRGGGPQGFPSFSQIAQDAEMRGAARPRDAVAGYNRASNEVYLRSGSYATSKAKIGQFLRAHEVGHSMRFARGSNLGNVAAEEMMSDILASLTSGFSTTGKQTSGKPLLLKGAKEEGAAFKARFKQTFSGASGQGLKTLSPNERERLYSMLIAGVEPEDLKKLASGRPGRAQEQVEQNIQQILARAQSLPKTQKARLKAIAGISDSDEKLAMRWVEGLRRSPLWHDYGRGIGGATTPEDQRLTAMLGEGQTTTSMALPWGGGGGWLKKKMGGLYEGVKAYSQRKAMSPEALAMESFQSAVERFSRNYSDTAEAARNEVKNLVKANPGMYPMLYGRMQKHEQLKKPFPDSAYKMAGYTSESMSAIGNLSAFFDQSEGLSLKDIGAATQADRKVLAKLLPDFHGKKRISAAELKHMKFMTDALVIGGEYISKGPSVRQVSDLSTVFEKLVRGASGMGMGFIHQPSAEKVVNLVGPISQAIEHTRRRTNELYASGAPIEQITAATEKQREFLKKSQLVHSQFFTAPTKREDIPGWIESMSLGGKNGAFLLGMREIQQAYLRPQGKTGNYVAPYGDAAHQAKIRSMLEQQVISENALTGRRRKRRTQLTWMNEEGGAVSAEDIRFNTEGKMVRHQEIPLQARDNVMHAIRKVALWAVATTAFYGSMRLVRGGIGVIKEIQDAVVDLQKILPSAQADFKGLSSEILNHAKRYGSIIKESAQVFTAYVRQGRSLSDTMQLYDASMLASNATTMDAVEATKFLTVATKSLKIPVENAISLIDGLANVESKHAITAKDIAEGIQKAGGAAYEAGVGFASLAAQITAIGAATQRPGSEIGTMLKTLYVRLFTPQSLGAMRELARIEPMEKDGKSYKSATTILEELAQAWQKMGNVQRKELARLLAGQRRYNQFVVLMNNWKEAQEAMTEAQEGSGLAYRRNAMAIQALSKQMTIARAKWAEFATQIGESGGLTLLTTSAKGLGLLANALTALAKVPIAGNMITYMGTILALFSSTAFVTSMAGWETASAGIGSVFKNFNEVFSLAHGAKGGHLRNFSAGIIHAKRSMLQFLGLAAPMSNFKRNFGGIFAPLAAIGPQILGLVKMAAIFGVIVGAVSLLTRALDKLYVSFDEQSDKLNEIAAKRNETISSIKDEINALKNLKATYEDVYKSASKASSVGSVNRGGLSTGNALETMRMIENTVKLLPKALPTIDKVLKSKGLQSMEFYAENYNAIGGQMSGRVPKEYIPLIKLMSRQGKAEFFQNVLFGGGSVSDLSDILNIAKNLGDIVTLDVAKKSAMETIEESRRSIERASIIKDENKKAKYIEQGKRPNYEALMQLVGVSIKGRTFEQAIAEDPELKDILPKLVKSYLAASSGTLPEDFDLTSNDKLISFANLIYESGQAMREATNFVVGNLTLFSNSIEIAGDRLKQYTARLDEAGRQASNARSLARFYSSNASNPIEGGVLDLLAMQASGGAFGRAGGNIQNRQVMTAAIRDSMLAATPGRRYTRSGVQGVQEALAAFRQISASGGSYMGALNELGSRGRGVASMAYGGSPEMIRLLGGLATGGAPGTRQPASQALAYYMATRRADIMSSSLSQDARASALGQYNTSLREASGILGDPNFSSQVSSLYDSVKDLGGREGMQNLNDKFMEFTRALGPDVSRHVLTLSQEYDAMSQIALGLSASVNDLNDKLRESGEAAEVADEKTANLEDIIKQLQDNVDKAYSLYSEFNSATDKYLAEREQMFQEYTARMREVVAEYFNPESFYAFQGGEFSRAFNNQLGAIKAMVEQAREKFLGGLYQGQPQIADAKANEMMNMLVAGLPINRMIQHGMGNLTAIAGQGMAQSLMESSVFGQDFQVTQLQEIQRILRETMTELVKAYEFDQSLVQQVAANNNMSVEQLFQSFSDINSKMQQQIDGARRQQSDIFTPFSQKINKQIAKQILGGFSPDMVPFLMESEFFQKNIGSDEQRWYMEQSRWAQQIRNADNVTSQTTAARNYIQKLGVTKQNVENSEAEAAMNAQIANAKLPESLASALVEMNNFMSRTADNTEAMVRLLSGTVPSSNNEPKADNRHPLLGAYRGYTPNDEQLMTFMDGAWEAKKASTDPRYPAIRDVGTRINVPTTQ